MAKKFYCGVYVYFQFGSVFNSTLVAKSLDDLIAIKEEFVRKELEVPNCRVDAIKFGPIKVETTTTLKANRFEDIVLNPKSKNAYLK